MKILYLAQNTKWYGDNVSLFNIINSIKDSNTILVLLPNDKCGLFCSKLESINIDFHFVKYMGLTIYPQTKNPLRFLIRLIKKYRDIYFSRKIIKKEIINFNPDIVHTNVGPMDLAFSTCLKFNLPHVWHIREYQDLDFNMEVIPSKQSFEKRLHEKGNYCISITKRLYEYWNMRADYDVVIYDGLFNTPPPLPAKKEKYFLFVGRVQEAKGLISILEPMKLFLKKYPNYKLIVAGNYNKESIYYKKVLKKINTLNISQNITFLGEIDNVYFYMQRATAIIVPSFNEGFGFVTTEAMYNNCFVIGRNVAGTKEQFDNCRSDIGYDLFYRFEKDEEIYKGLLFSVEKDTSEKTILASKYVSEKYSIYNSSLKFMDYYNKILNQSN